MQFLIQLIWDGVQDSEFLTIFWGDADVVDLGPTFEELGRESQKSLTSLDHLIER